MKLGLLAVVLLLVSTSLLAPMRADAQTVDSGLVVSIYVTVVGAHNANADLDLLRDDAVLTVVPAKYASAAEVQSPSSVIQAWVTALDAEDSSAALALLEDDAVIAFLSSPPGGTETYSGKTEIKGALNNFESENTRFSLVGTPNVTGDEVTWTENQTSDSLQQLGIDSINIIGQGVVQQGKIRAIIYTLTPESAQQIEAAAGYNTGAIPGNQPAVGMPKTGQQDYDGYLWLVLWGCLSISAGLAMRLIRSKAGA